VAITRSTASVYRWQEANVLMYGAEFCSNCIVKRTKLRPNNLIPSNLYHNHSFLVLVPRSCHRRSIDKECASSISQKRLPQSSRQLRPQQLPYTTPASVDIPEHVQLRTDTP